MSPRQAERIIKDYYGSSFRKLRYESKMAMAASLLESENITINECAAKCGYTSLSSFAAAFRRNSQQLPYSRKDKQSYGNLSASEQKRQARLERREQFDAHC